jgi:hypothetical protein
VDGGYEGGAFKLRPAEEGSTEVHFAHPPKLSGSHGNQQHLFFIFNPLEYERHGVLCLRYIHFLAQ